mgnify:CR=1 FL=1
MAKFCTKCGKEISEDAVICIHCGCSIESANASNDSDSKSWWCLGFFTSLFLTPLIGLILWLVWKDEAPKKARNVGLGTLWSLLPVGIIIVVSLIIYFVAIGSLMGISGAVAPIMGAVGLLL